LWEVSCNSLPYDGQTGSNPKVRVADHPGASETSRESVRRMVLTSVRERFHVGTAHQKMLDFGYLEVSHVSQFLILNHPVRYVRA
jgi:hypothetical protein